MGPLISIIVPVYNAEKTVARCVKSILTQTYQPIELILVDDGSTDNSLAICDELRRDVDCIKVLHQSNHGVSAARNNGIRHASGSLLCFVDADDMLDKKMLTTLVSKMSESDDIDIISCCCYANSSDHKVLNRFYSSNKTFDRTFENKKELYFQLLDTAYGQPQDEVYTGIGVPWGKLYKRKLFVDHGILFDESLTHYEDNFLNFQLFSKAKKIIYINLPLYYYSTNHITTVLSQYDRAIVQSYVKVSLLRYEYADQNGFFKHQEFRELCAKQTAELMNISVFLMIFDEKRRVHKNEVIRDLRWFNEELGAERVLRYMDLETMENRKTKLIYKLLVAHRYSTVYYIMILRGAVKKILSAL